MIITYRAGMVGSWDNGVKVGVEAGGHVSRESINVIGCEAARQFSGTNFLNQLRL